MSLAKIYLCSDWAFTEKKKATRDVLDDKVMDYGTVLNLNLSKFTQSAV